MKIKLIQPGQLDTAGGPLKVNREFVPGLTLPYVAALIPGDHDIAIVEDSVEVIDFDEPVDLVGLTAMTCRAPRAYWIADQYRQRGVPVVMGGFHASVLPEEALAHCDAVVKGEAEGIMAKVIEDARSGRMKGVYEQPAAQSLDRLPVPRYDLINMKNFFLPAYPVQVTRGCPYHCDFCSVATFFNNRHRKRPIPEVLADMRAAGPYMLIVDDNLMADRDYAYALELFVAMKPLEKMWMGQVDVHAAADDKLMAAASAAGCRMLYLGIETVDVQNMIQTRKTPNIHTDVSQALMNLKRHHIEACVSMIIGFDRDTVETGKQIVEFCNRMRVPILFLYVLTPIPGSPMFYRMRESGIALRQGWHLYDGAHSVFDTPTLTSEALQDLYMDIQKQIYSMSSIFRRTVFPPHFLMFVFNLWARKNIRSGIHPWMGDTRWGGRLNDLVFRFGEPLFKPWAREISRLLRFTEGRFTH